MNHMEILKNIAVPRPNHSEQVDKTAGYIQELLTGWNIDHTVETFSLYPHKMPIVGAAILILALIFFLAAWKKRPVIALIAALALPALLILEVEFFVPIVSPLIQKTGQNIVVSHTVPDAAREIIFCAHYDSKTDFFDHIQRAKIYRFIPHFIALAVLLSIWLFLGKKFKGLSSGFPSALVTILAGVMVVFWGLVGLGFGGYVFMGPKHHSPGAVDNGGSVVTLLALAKDIHDGKVNTGKSNVTIVLSGGEEVGPQGAGHYVKNKFGKKANPKMPTCMVNLELVAQKGNMIYWKRNGVFLIFRPADNELIERLNRSWLDISGKPMDEEEKLTDDALHFMAAGIPAVTVGNCGKPGMGLAGFHSPHDNMDRVESKNLELMIATLSKYIEDYN